MNQETCSYRKVRTMVRLAAFFPGAAACSLAVAPAVFVTLLVTGRYDLTATYRMGISAGAFFCVCALMQLLLGLIPVLWLGKYREQPVFLLLTDYTQAYQHRETRASRLVLGLAAALIPPAGIGYALFRMRQMGPDCAELYYGLMFVGAGLTLGCMLAAVLRFLHWGRLEFCIAERPLELDKEEDSPILARVLAALILIIAVGSILLWSRLF